MGITDQVKGYIPEISTSQITNVFILVFVIGIIGAILGFISYTVYMKKKFNKNIVVFEKVGKTIEPTRKDTACIMPWGEGGDTIFFSRKSQKYLPTPRIQTGRNTYWYFIREDGEWINFGVEDIDEHMRELKAHFLDKEMRYARTAIQKNLRDRFQKISFWEKYGGLIVWTVLILVTGVAMWLIFDKWLEVSNALVDAVKAAKEVVESAKQILGVIDSMKGTGGIRTA